MTKPESLDSYVYERQEKYKTDIKALEAEKAILQEKADKIEKQLKDAEEVPKTYSAARWGAISSRDALVKRLTTDFENAYDDINKQKQKINACNKGNETVDGLINAHEKVEEVYKQHIKNRNDFWEELYGKQKPLTDLKQVEWEYEGDMVEETDTYVWYRFGPRASMESCLRALAVANYNVVRVGDREFEVTKKER
jgi:chromosome segregation ATPase